jgi:queuine tRNA-ribosyltransferase
MLEETVPLMPTDKPRYLMGVGTPDYLIEGAIRGIDMFDCVLPTRIGRNGTVLTRKGRLIVRDAKYARDFAPIESDCTCYVCQNYPAPISAISSRPMRCSACAGILHNLHFLLQLMADVRQASPRTDCSISGTNSLKATAIKRDDPC